MDSKFLDEFWQKYIKNSRTVYLHPVMYYENDEN